MTRPAVRLSDNLADQIIAHCLAELPNEGCGLFAMDRDSIVKVYPTSNASESPVSFTVPPEEHYAILEDAEANGWRLGGVYHSHPYGSAVMSMVDLQAALDPEWVYLVVGLQGAPVIRAWQIRDDEFTEVELVTTSP